MYLRVERLDVTKEEYRWKMVNERVFWFVLGSESEGESERKSKEIHEANSSKVSF